MTLLKYIPKHIKYIVSMYLFGLILFSTVRILLFISSFKLYQDLPTDIAKQLIASALWMGIRFDTVISGYLLITPLVIISLLALFKIEKKWIYQTITQFNFVVYSLALLICSLDIPYFASFGNRLSMDMAGRLYNNSSFIFKMFFQEIRYYGALIPFIIIIIILYKGVQLLQENTLYSTAIIKPVNKTGTFLFYVANLIISVLVIGLTILGIRGRIAEKSPILVNTAYFSNYAFPNQLGLNPVFTLMRSYLDGLEEKNRRINYINEEEAVKYAKKLLNRGETNDTNSPMSKKVSGSKNSSKPNIVLVIMESMASAKMGYFDSNKTNTPFLDKLANEGLIFENIYSAGIHTFNGIYGTIFSHPALKAQHPMEKVTIPKFAGIATALKTHGYQTSYFTTHDDQFDGVAGFLQFNDYDGITSQKDYPDDKILSTLGVPDDYMFEFSISKLNKMAATKKPFLATYMTASDHGPYKVPSYYKRKYELGKEDQEIIGYADWSIEKFLKMAAKESWYTNTIFVFVADHGSHLDGTYELSLTQNHIPLIIYSPKLLQPMKYKQMGCQIDVFPTIMGLTGLSYINNTLGIDLLNEKRPYSYFSADDKYGVTNDEWFLIVRNDGNKSLYKYRSKDLNNYYDANNIIGDNMQKYAETMFQTSQWMIDNNKTSTTQ